MLRSLVSGLSGIRTHQTALDVIGNNIANINTQSFKSSRASFSDALSLTLKGGTPPTGTRGGLNPYQIGRGSTVDSIDTLFTQGSLETTGNPTDLSIAGEGFFVMRHGDESIYTRDGSFAVDATGTLVDPNSGFAVQGRMADDSGNIMSATPITNIVLPIGSLFPARATSTASLTGNLDASAETGKIPFIGDTANASFSGNLGATVGVGVPFIGNATNASFSGNLSDTGTITTTPPTTLVKHMAIFDSLGNANDVTVTFVKTVDSDPAVPALDQWSWTASDTSGAATGTGTIEFNADGSYSATSTGNIITCTGWGTAGDIAVTLDLTEMTQKTAPFSVIVPTAADTPPYEKHIVIYDYLGNANDVTLTFAKTIDSSPGVPDEWSWTASDPSGKATGTGKITFNANGSYSNSVGTTITCAGWGTGGASDITVDMDIAQMTQTNGPFSPMLSYPVEDQTYQTSMQVYDSLGGTHNAIVNFEKDPLSANTWRWSIGVSGNDEVYINTPTGPSYSQQIVFGPDGTVKRSEE
ncbi:MAG: Flagellar hook protein FlgE, partial [Candidatus Poribacteria bacterium]|nr:Flagellar hook protein FlgE [Candidatus Poribacteria bacterium]